ncbi:MbtH family protein [Streptomyces sp. NPDC050617]|uniref:MbtH family protein n=1 Tax=Streptomyces sp. NPDC050617 TaxID=3154628 RepID=UPI0034368C55
MFEDDDRRYAVVRNHEDQYSVWPEDRAAPDGWEPVGVSGSKSECLSHITAVWTDLRPLSLRA